MEHSEGSLPNSLPGQLTSSGENVVAEQMKGLSITDKMALINSFAHEITTEPELEALLTNKPNPVAYDGFEPSGRMHIAQGVMKALNVNKLSQCGVRFKFWVADWFAQLNNKMGGDLKKIKVVGEYMIEVWKAVGMNLDMVDFLWASDEINARPHEYWTLVMDIAIKFKLARIMRCTQIMGRDDSDLQASQIFYPCMQCADIFYLKADICQLGNDQRKVNMLAREYCEATKRKLKPVIVSHSMLPGLKEGQEKMSKSDPDSAIFMEDSEADVNAKIKKAFCPPGIVENNPCIEYIRFIVLPWFDKFVVLRTLDNGGDMTYVDMESLIKDYESGHLHPGDLKPALTRALNLILAPVRKHFQTDKRAADLLKRVKSYKVTR